MKLPRRKTRPSPDTIMTPEGVPLTLRVAGIGVRLAAQISDVAITFVAAVCFILLLAQANLVDPQTLFAVGMLLFFLIRVPYYILSELIWNGQTLGKRFMRIKVVSHDGRTLTTHAIVLRNMVKEAEVFLPATLLLTLDKTTPVTSFITLGWIAMALLIPLVNPYRQRLGDLLAATHVIHLPQPVLLKELAAQSATETVAGGRIQFLAHQLDHYGAFELQTLESLLRVDLGQLTANAQTSHLQTLATVVEKVRRKIGYADPVAKGDHLAFLTAFYTAQRAHLEQRQLFGDRRADKHHAASSE